MRKIFAFLMTSLDGYHEGPQDERDWHNVDEDFHDFAVTRLDEADTLLFGRKTYQMMAAFWPAEAGLQGDPEVAKRMNELPKVVISRSLPSADWQPASVIDADVPGAIAGLKEQPGKDIALLGSSALAATLLRAGLIDELRIMVNPVVLGSGHPVLAGASRTPLELAAVRQFRSGNILLTYRAEL